MENTQKQNGTQEQNSAQVNQFDGMASNAVYVALANRVRIVEVKDTITGETAEKRRAVNLKRTDFENGDTYKHYCKRILVLANAISDFAAKDDDNRGKEFKAITSAIEGVYTFLRAECHFPEQHARNSETRFMTDRVADLKISKTENDFERVSISLALVKSRFESVLFYRVNGKPLPTAQTAASIATANAKAAAADKAAAEKAAKEKADKAAAEKAAKARAAAEKAAKAKPTKVQKKQAEQACKASANARASLASVISDFSEKAGA